MQGLPGNRLCVSKNKSLRALYYDLNSTTYVLTNTVNAQRAVKPNSSSYYTLGHPDVTYRFNF